MTFFLPYTAHTRVPDIQNDADYFASIEEDLDWLKSLSSTLPTGDKRLLFADIYHEVTKEMKVLFEENRFNNPVWVERLMLKYVSLYKHALDCSLAPCALSPSWQTAFGSHQSNKYKPGVQLLLSISAHVNRDLPIALAAIETDFKDEKLKQDYRKIALIFDRRMPSLIQLLKNYQRCRVSKVDRKLIDRIIRWAMNSTRDQSWEYGKKLSAIHSLEEEKQLMMNIEAHTKKENKIIFRYAPLASKIICL